MLRNYFIIAWRNLQRNKVNSFINIAGLAIGMSCVILIAIYVQDELSYDRFFKKVGNLYQVNMTGSDNGVLFSTGNTAPAVGPTMVKSFPEIESCARIYRPGDVLVRYEENAKTETYYTEKQVLGVDSNFLQLFDYSILEGDPATCLQKPNSIVLTEQSAKKYFGNKNAIGKILLLENDKRPFVVTAVLKNLPAQSTFQFDMLAPIAAYAVVKKRSWNWFWLQVTTYVKLKDHIAQDAAGLAKLEAKFPPMVKEHAFQSMGDLEVFAKKGGRLDYQLMPFTAVHLYARENNTVARLTTLGDIKYVYIFSVIAMIIIILACVNFMNLSTAQSVKRAKEVGIRKVLGSVKVQLIKQFLTEAILYSVIATVIALIIVLPLLKPFNEITGKSLVFSSIFAGYIWLFILVLCLGMGLLAGLYPAFYLTAFNPVEVLKGVRNIKTSIGNLLVRNGLVVFQFSISIALIICTAIVFKQLQYIQNKDLGLNKENVLVISNTDRLKNDEESFRQELLKQPGVMNASISSSIPSRGNFGDGYVPEQSQTDKPLIKEIGLSSFMVDDAFMPTFQMQVLQGRNFSKKFNDSASVILNETAAKQIGWKDPVGKYLGYPGNDQQFKVIGVVRDFNIASLHEEIEPFALFHNSSKTYTLGHSYISVRLQAGNTRKYLGGVENKWKVFAPDSPFDFSFLDGEFESLYRSEQSMGTVFAIFTFLSIFVACLGLFGLSIYTLARRTKEIGVRKVLGASVQNIVALVSKDFLKLVLISAIIAIPFAWAAMNKWLEDFAYRITIGWAVFVLASFLALLIALFTISFQAVRAAKANPVNSLRTE
jgi:putative ABC transport system permease protein